MDARSRTKEQKTGDQQTRRVKIEGEFNKMITTSLTKSDYKLDEAI